MGSSGKRGFCSDMGSSLVLWLPFLQASWGKPYALSVSYDCKRHMPESLSPCSYQICCLSVLMLRIMKWKSSYLSCFSAASMDSVLPWPLLFATRFSCFCLAALPATVCTSTLLHVNELADCPRLELNFRAKAAYLDLQLSAADLQKQGMSCPVSLSNVCSWLHVHLQVLLGHYSSSPCWPLEHTWMVQICINNVMRTFFEDCCLLLRQSCCLLPSKLDMLYLC